MSIRLHRLLLALVLAVYLVLALGFGANVPLFEAPDEHMHYFTADFIAREGRLPTTRDPGLMAQEAAQPPLYYVLASILVRAVPNTAIGDNLWLNPRGDPADPRGESLANPPMNINVFIHGPAETWPWRGYALAAHLTRMMSAVLGLGTLLCIYGAGRTVWPAAPDRALLATALIAFLPQFAFVHGAVTNDAAITFFCAAALWQLLRIRNDELAITNKEMTPEIDGQPVRVKKRAGPSVYVILGITIGLAMLSKTAGLLLLVYGTAVVAALVWNRGGTERWKQAAGAATLVAIPALLLAGWWLGRNWVLYGDPTAANQFILLTGGERPYSLAQVWHDFDRVWTSLFARFGWMNLRPPVWVWLAWSAIAGLAAAGALGSLAASIRRRRGAPQSPSALLFHPAFLLFSWFALVALGWLQFMLRTPADQGRLLFPALVPLALGMAYGLSRWPRPWVQAALGLALVTSVYSLAVVIPTAYDTPPIVAAIPAGVAPLDIDFDEGLELLGAHVETPSVKAGEWAWLTLYWRARDELASGAPLVYLEAFGRGYERVGLQVNYQGRGNFPATLWPVGEIVADRIAVRIADEAIAPVEARLTVKVDENGEGIDVGTVKVSPSTWPESGAPIARLGDSIELIAADVSTGVAAPGDTVEIRLRWQVIAPPGPALLHYFVHLGDSTQPPLAQADGVVMGGEYPPGLWEAGEVFEETVGLVVPAGIAPGEYPVNIGLYGFDTGVRLPVIVDDERLPNDSLLVGHITIR